MTCRRDEGNAFSCRQATLLLVQRDTRISAAIAPSFSVSARQRQLFSSYPHIGEAYERTGVAVISMGVNESDDGTRYDV
jgi:hypothetical protein